MRHRQGRCTYAIRCVCTHNDLPANSKNVFIYDTCFVDKNDLKTKIHFPTVAWQYPLWFGLDRVLGKALMSLPTTDNVGKTVSLRSCSCLRKTVKISCYHSSKFKSAEIYKSSYMGICTTFQHTLLDTVIGFFVLIKIISSWKQLPKSRK